MIQSIAGKLNAAEDAKKLAKAWFVEQLQIKRALAPNLWGSLLKMLQIEADSINANTSAAKITIEKVNDNQVNIRNAMTGVMVSLKYDPDTPCVWYRTPGP